MKISYGENIKLYGPEGTYYTQRILLTEREFNSINLSIESEIAMSYPQSKLYSESEMHAQLYLKKLIKDYKQSNLCFLTLTQIRYITKFVETKGRLKTDRNTYIQIISEKPKLSPENISIKSWYLKTYPTDELGKYIKSGITFYDAFKCLDTYKEFYKFLGVDDSTVRERVFEQLALVMNSSYSYIYNQWLRTHFK